MATPLDAVEYGAGDVAPTEPVDTSSLPVSTPASAAPGVDSDALQSQPLNGGQPLAPDNTAAAAPPKPSYWRNVLHGALAGMEQGGGVGALIGAVDPNLAIGAKNDKIAARHARSQFAGLQVADMQLENAIRKHQLEMAPEEFRLKQVEAYAPIVKSLLDQGIYPTVTSQAGDSNSQLEALHGLGAANNGVIPGSVDLPTADGKFLHFDLSQLGKSKAALDNVNLMQLATGGTQYTPQTFYNKTLTPLPVRQKALYEGQHFWMPTVSNRNQLEANRGKYQNIYDTAQLHIKNGDSDPRWQTIAQNAQGTQKYLDSVEDFFNKQDFAHAKLQAKTQMDANEARAKAWQQFKYGEYLDPSGKLITTTAIDAANRGLTPAAHGVKALGSTAILNDVVAGSANMRAAISKLDQPFTSDQIATLGLAMSAKDDTITRQIIESKLGSQRLDESQNQFVTALLNLHERAMSVRALQGQGTRSSEMMQRLILQMLPGLKDNPALMVDKMNAFDQQTRILGSGIPKVNVKGVAPGKTEGSAPKPTQNNSLAGKTFSISKFLSTHKGANAADVRAQAAKAGMKVVP